MHVSVSYLRPIIYTTANRRKSAERMMGYLPEIALPFDSKETITLSQKGDELTVKVGSYKRNLYLPCKLQGRDAFAARLEDCLVNYSPLKWESFSVHKKQ